MEKQNNLLRLPCMRGKIGDWFYYNAIMKFKDVAERVKLPQEIDNRYSDENLRLGEWIQRKIEPKRIQPLVNYIKNQKQIFFNSIVLGIYDGAPSWQDINISNLNQYNNEELDNIEYFSKTFGILSLTGDESIFAIDGQHRAMGIRKAFKEQKLLGDEEISVIFLAHNTDIDGQVRTRRLFSTLNRYAKPVNENEKIALSEDDNCAILTRKLVDEYVPFKSRILLHKTRSINPSNSTHFTNIMVLYDIVTTLLVEKTISGVGLVKGKNKNTYLHERVNQSELDLDYKYLTNCFDELIDKIPDLKLFFKDGKNLDRSSLSSSLIFRPIGQNIFFDVFKGAISQNKKNEFLNYFKTTIFALSNNKWYTIFWDSETNNIATDKTRQKFATMNILELIGVDVKKTKKDLEVEKEFSK